MKAPCDVLTFSIGCFDLLWCPDRHWPCRRWDVTFSNSRAWPSPKSVGSPWRNRLAFQKSNLKAPCEFSRFSPNILRAQNGLMLSLALIFSDVLIGKDLLKQSLLTFFRVNRESRRNRTNEIRRNERSCRGQAWQHRVTFSRCLDLLWCLDRHWLCQG